MYTQCPDCSTAFRVTAEVLKQAAGKVRCGGCGNAFNALSYLSESLPEQAAPQETGADAAVPELKPEDPPSDGLPVSISAEQSAALLKTLDELAGSDIRIEDTGVEWRVLDDDEIGDAAADEIPVKTPVQVAGADLVIDEFLDESPTPVDQFLTKTPAVVDSPEIFEEPPLEFSRTSVDEIRFDDNTQLPDDFGLDDDGNVEGDFGPQAAAEESIDEESGEAAQEYPQTDLDLSEPDEWSDILGEFEDLAVAVAAPADEEVDDELDEELHDETDEDPEVVAKVEPELESDLETELDELEIPAEPDGIDEPLDMDSQFALQAEAMGIDLSGMHETVKAEIDAAADEEVDLDELLKESSEEDLELEDLLDEELVDEVDEENLEPLSEDITQLDLIDDDDDIVDQEAEEQETTGDLESEFEFDPGNELEDDLEELHDDLEDELDEDLEEIEEDPEAELDEDPDEAFEEESSKAPEQADDEDTSGGHFVPPLTEEEQTINMQIDQDLLALAIEDEDGFASTIIIPGDAGEAILAEDRDASEDYEAAESLKDTSAGFETIIMEGEAFRSADTLDKPEIDTATAALLAGSVAANSEAEQPVTTGGRRYGLVGGIVALLLVFAAQYVHQSRETLATIPAFNNAVGPLYRAVGQPISPAWDITGWRFEVAKGTEEGDEGLTIYSRLGNKSESPLPYPLIGISLTDRFEETIGSRVLDPADYLPNDLDPRKLVQPGNTFEAVITIESPAEATAGFRLRACYRTTDGLLRCKDDGFK